MTTGMIIMAVCSALGAICTCIGNWAEAEQKKLNEAKKEVKPTGYVTLTDPDGVRIKIERPINRHPEMDDPWE